MKNNLAVRPKEEWIKSYNNVVGTTVSFPKSQEYEDYLKDFKAELRQRMLEQMNDLGTVHQDGSITFRHMKVPKISIREILGEEGDVK